MTRAGILSSSYKFKVLSLDSRSDQYLIMMDLGRLLNGALMATSNFSTCGKSNSSRKDGEVVQSGRNPPNPCPVLRTRKSVSPHMVSVARGTENLNSTRRCQSLASL
jgi:hypothetical protein